MSDVADSYSDGLSEASDAEDDDLWLAQPPSNQEGLKQSNLFFVARQGDEKSLFRSNQIYKRNHYEKGLTKDKRTTVQQVLDKRTYIRLRKLCGQGVFHYMHGVISTGKEANVFEAETQPPSSSAISHNASSDVNEVVTVGQTVPCVCANHLVEAHVSAQSNGTGAATCHPGEGTNVNCDEVADKISACSIKETLQPKNTDESSRSTEKQTPGRVAIKVYKTSILVFKDRSRYIEGEFRFRRAYLGTKNPRKMVAQWAEKEFRNLRRIALSGLYSPIPIALKDHVLVMDLILDGSAVAPKVENLGALPLFEWQTIYVQTICALRTLFQECKLIHGDFSSFNLLYSNGKVYVIDTSQAVENDHLNAMPFLKRDCENVTRFFKNADVLHHEHEQMIPYDELKLLTAEQLFCFIISKVIEPIDDVIDEDNAKALPLSHDHELWQDDSLANVKCFWNINESEIALDVAQSVEKMTKYYKFGATKDIPEIMMNKRKMYLSLCKATYDFLTGPTFANEECYSHIAWLRNYNFDKQLPINISQMPLDVAESLMEQKENVIIGINAIVDKTSCESVEEACCYVDDKGEADSDESESDGTSDTEELAKQTNDVGGNNTDQRAKFTGKIPDGVEPREWKKMVKEYNRERRKSKIPKHIKKKYGSNKG
ncbi:serine/threonine protein kinase, putative [Babesia bigemina]|uniref:non-specific serine/threonine protein kinase n=1 Tax=Babesia bigemina TaxID=5866 RepID=A0A061D5Z7_BABBI|nr:serine/threonine protein kinase, putative [Babesia bigemina]CDR94334.1 serine/threonine protein kinase, putative [Babesia bigemina]|eukprot:XP_012766520.1 serine/threonine protein kinase, putative [Babesia bigemina]